MSLFGYAPGEPVLKDLDLLAPAGGKGGSGGVFWGREIYPGEFVAEILRPPNRGRY